MDKPARPLRGSNHRRPVRRVTELEGLMRRELDRNGAPAIETDHSSQRPDSRTVREISHAVASGEVTREAAHDWSSEWVERASHRGPDPMVVSALYSLHGYDSASSAETCRRKTGEGVCCPATGRARITRTATCSCAPSRSRIGPISRTASFAGRQGRAGDYVLERESCP